MKDERRKPPGFTPKLPTSGHPLVIRLFQEIIDQRIPLVEVARRSGLDVVTLHRLRQRAPNGLINFEAALNSIGLELHIRRRK